MLSTNTKIVPQQVTTPDDISEQLNDSNLNAPESSVDVSETLQMISNLDIKDKMIDHNDISSPNSIKKKIFKLNPIKRLNISSVKKQIGNTTAKSISISRSLSQSGSHTPPGISPIISSKKQANLASIDTLKLSSKSGSDRGSRTSSQNNSETGSDRSTQRSNLISSINSESEYITPRSDASQRSGSISSLSSMEWDTKNMKKWNKDKTKQILFRCTRHGKHKKVRNMLEKGINPNIMDEYGNTILIVAAQNGSKRLVKTALRYNANMDHQNYRGNTALHYAFSYGYKLLAEYMLSKGADDRIKNEFGLTCYEGINLNTKHKLLNSKNNKTHQTVKEILKNPEQNKSL